MKQQQKWRKLNGERVGVSIEDEIRSAIVREKQLGHEMKVCIGTDSQVKARPNSRAGRGKETAFATVIVLVRKGKGGFMYINNEITTNKMSIKQRMLVEVSKSIAIADRLCRIFTLYNVDMELHADINTNPNFKSNDALKEAMGYIMGMSARMTRSDGGFAFKAKPDAFASSSCANKMVQ